MSNKTEDLHFITVCEIYRPLPISVYVDIVYIVFSVFTIIIGITSWIARRKFRWFKNYILLSIIFNNTMNGVIRTLYMNLESIFAAIGEMYSDTILMVMCYFYLYFKSTLNYWLLVLCYVFYSDLVRVFNNYITRRYLKATLFSWILPLLLLTFNMTVFFSISDILPDFALGIQVTYMYVPLVMNIIMYLIIVFTVFRVNSTDIESYTNRRHKPQYRSVLLLTIIFTLCGLFMLTLPLFQNRKHETIIAWLIMILYRVQDFSLNIYFFIVKHNVSVWRNYYKKRSIMRKDFGSLASLNY